VSAGNTGQLAAFLRSRRARLTPADVGLLRLEDQPGSLMVIQAPADAVSQDRMAALRPGRCESMG
jgi:hypothetical protein